MTLEVKLPPTVYQRFNYLIQKESLEKIEANPFAWCSELEMPEWGRFKREVRDAWETEDHVLVRGTPCGNGASTILTSLVLGAAFRTYRDDKIVKHFKMSPWTTALSQTLAEGHFHTDLNTAPTPPAATIIQCHRADPTPGAGENRVALLTNLLNVLEQAGEDDTLRFLLETDIEMVDEKKHGSWIGKIVQDGTIRFHPETLRAAQRRNQSLPLQLEHYLAKIKDYALAVSKPISLDVGDTLIVSNTRALHYRGPCTARYIKFPRQFEAREIFVLHLMDEPAWQDR